MRPRNCLSTLKGGTKSKVFQKEIQGLQEIDNKKFPNWVNLNANWIRRILDYPYNLVICIIGGITFHDYYEGNYSFTTIYFGMPAGKLLERNIGSESYFRKFPIKVSCRHLIDAFSRNAVSREINKIEGLSSIQDEFNLVT